MDYNGATSNNFTCECHHWPVKLCPPVKLNFNSKNKWVKVWVTEGAHAKIMYQTAKLRPDDNMHLKYQEGSFLTDTLDIHLLD